MPFIELTQYLRPNGIQKKVSMPADEETAKLAEGMILSTEVLSTGEVVVYARYKNESEEKEFSEIGENGPGENSPTECLKRVIKRKADEK